MASIAKITKAYVRRYTDNGQVTAYVEWIDARGKPGRTEGTLRYFNIPHRAPCFTFGTHMHALFARAKREGVSLTRETW